MAAAVVDTPAPTVENLTEVDVLRTAAVFSPLDFAVHAGRGRWERAAHLELINTKLIQILDGKLKRLMVFMPPRHGKSDLISRHFPVVYLGLNPDKRVILTSYEADFASTWGWKARNLMTEFGADLWSVDVDETSSARDRWDLRGHAGGMITAGSYGPITGRGGDLVIVDDPIKNHEDANSKLQREKLWDWDCSTLQTRVEPNGTIVLIMTRWHEDDLAGRLLRDQPGKWDVLSLPALAEANDPLGRQPGEVLWPERWPLDQILERKAAAGSYYWQALYQQRPAPDDGAIFRRQWFRYFGNGAGTFKLLKGDDAEPEPVECEKCWKFSTVDLAASTKTSADYTVVSTWAVTPKRQLLWLDCRRVRLEGPDQTELLRKVHKEYDPAYMLVEKVGYQLSLIQAARREGLPIREGIVDKDKLSRALPAAARMEGGDVYLPHGVPWVHDAEAELLSFPRGAHDDQVDTLSAAVAEVARRGGSIFG